MGVSRCGAAAPGVGGGGSAAAASSAAARAGGGDDARAAGIVAAVGGASAPLLLLGRAPGWKYKRAPKLIAATKIETVIRIRDAAAVGPAAALARYNPKKRDLPRMYVRAGGAN